MDAARAHPAHPDRSGGRFYRPGLDALRFIAFAAVFIHHGFAGWSPVVKIDRFVQSLGFGLCLFFTLSAYLITTLLLREREQTGGIALSLFYRRRILRIWPLYFFGLGIGIMLDKRTGLFPANKVFYEAALLMCANWVAPIATDVLHLWSISVEEQFYLFWPGVLKKASHRQLYWVAALLISISATVTGVFGYLRVDNTLHVWFNSFVQMQMFGAGILLAVWQARNAPLLKNLLARISVFCITPMLWFVSVRYLSVKDGFAKGAAQEVAGYLIVALCCALMVDAMSTARSVPRWTIALGRISFGLYVFHIPALHVTQRLFPAWHLHLLLPVAALETLLAAMLSYRFLEMPFLRLKSKLEVVKSRPISASPL